jgi:hypothetical protein
VGDQVSHPNKTNGRIMVYFTINYFLKLLEKVMYSRLSKNMHCNNILVPEQFDFREDISTEDVACKQTVLYCVNQKMQEGRIFCDLVKAVDCANHEIL